MFYKLLLTLKKTLKKKLIMNHKILKVLTGTLGFEVVKGSGPTNRQLPPLRIGDRSHYNNPIVKVNEADIERWKNLRGGPLMFEHGKGQSQKITVGSIVDSVVTKQNTLYITASIWDTDEGKWAAKHIENGDISSFSIGYEFERNAHGELLKKNFNEVSLVIKPFFDGANISVCASDSQMYNNDNTKNSNKIDIPIMEEPKKEEASTTSTSAGTSANVEKISSRALELELEKEKKEREEQKKISDALLLEREQERKELDMLRAEKEARLMEQGNKKVEELNQALLKTKKALNLEKLPDGYEETMQKIARNSVLMDQNNPLQKTAEVTASVTTMFGNKVCEMSNENDALKKELAEMKKKYSEFEKDINYHAERITASKVTTPNVPPQQQISQKVEASATGGDISDIFVVVQRVKSGTNEARAYQQHNPAFDTIHVHGVNASSSSGSGGQDDFVEIKKAPNHRLAHMVKGSLRNRVDADGYRVGEAWFGILVDGYSKADGMATSGGFKMSKDLQKERGRV
jgi:hypothetical protein